MLVRVIALIPGGAGVSYSCHSHLTSDSASFRGKISLKSMVGAGTLVTVRLPLSQPEKVAQESRTSNMLDLDDIQNLEELMGPGVSYDEVVDAQACQAKSVRQLLVQPVESGTTVRFNHPLLAKTVGVVNTMSICPVLKSTSAPPEMSI